MTDLEKSLMGADINRLVHQHVEAGASLRDIWKALNAASEKILSDIVAKRHTKP